MKRLTKPGIIYNFPKLDIAEIRYLEKIQNRLAAYEDSGLEPGEIYEVRFLIAAQRDPQKLARLRELVLAEQAGRLVVLDWSGQMTAEPTTEKGNKT